MIVNDLLKPDKLTLNRGRLKSRNTENDNLTGVRILKPLELPELSRNGGGVYAG
jgi:hypothetical protein